MIYTKFNFTDRVEGANWDSYKSFESQEELNEMLEVYRDDMEVGFNHEIITEEQFINKEA